MKWKCRILSVVLILLVAVSACPSGNKDIGEEMKEQSSFSDLQDMEEITVDGNNVMIALLQDISLPYRWAITNQSENVSLIEDYEVEDPWEDSMFSVGSAEEYHVFVVELAEGELAQLEFYNQWVVEPENLEEANGKRKFTLEYVDGNWIVQGVD